MRLEALAARALALDPDPRAPLTLGLSGGGDSTALLHTLALASARSNRPLHAFIFDHGLRPDSAAEAQAAAEAAEKLGATPHIERWAQPDPRPATARPARHRFLARAALSLNARVLHLGHTLDDRLETLWMRLQRPGGWRRLHAMPARAPSPVWPDGAGLVLARPLLEERRAALRDSLAGLGAGWIDDPSNENRSHERIRARDLALSPDAGPGRMLLRLGRRAARLDRAANALAAPVLAAADILPWGAIRLDANALARLPDLGAERVIERAALAASGVPALTPSARRRLLAGVRADVRINAGGVLALPGGLLTRDPGAAAGRADGYPGAAPLHLQSGETGVFDGRFELAAPRALSVRAWARAHAPVSVPKAARPALAQVEAEERRPSLIGVDAGEGRFLGALRLAHLGLCDGDPSWFDAE